MSTLSSPSVHLRTEQPEDTAVIREISRAAFGAETQARLVDALRAAGAVTLSAVAVHGASLASEQGSETSQQPLLRDEELLGGEVVGHVLFTPVIVSTDEGDAELLGLGPVAVSPTRQHQGVGTMLVSGSLEHLRTRGYRGVVVIGEPGFFRRFGFIQASRYGLVGDPQVPDENFMALPLSSSALGGVAGKVRYRPEFDPPEEPG